MIRWTAIAISSSTAIPMAVLLAAGALKGLDAPSFLESIRTWQLIPAAAAPYLAIVLPAVELAIGLSWFLSIQRRLAAIAALTLLSAFTCAYLGHVVFATAPDCGCLGLLKLHHESRSQILLLTLRNSILIAALIIGLILNRPIGVSDD